MPAANIFHRSADLCDLAPAYVRSLAAYQPGKPIGELARELGLDAEVIIKLASNENPLGPSPLAMRAIQTALIDVARYPDGSGFGLKNKLAQFHDVATDEIILGNGSNDVLELAARVFLVPGSEAIYSQHAFAVYPLAVQAAGAAGVEVPAQDFGHDLNATLRAVTIRTRLVFIANPNNPTGTLLGVDALLSFLSALSSDILVVLDEAYYEYLPDEVRSDSVAWLRRFPNLIVTRTFSKAYGLAGLRVGYALADARIADLMNRVRQPFNVNSVALAAATAALDDREFVRQSFALNQRALHQITTGLADLDLDWIPSSGNFVSFRVREAENVFRGLLQRGVIVRPIASYGLPDYLRVSSGLEMENARFLKTLEQVIS